MVYLSHRFANAVTRCPSASHESTTRNNTVTRLPRGIGARLLNRANAHVKLTHEERAELLRYITGSHATWGKITQIDNGAF